MDAANALDWSMGSYAARLADWERPSTSASRVVRPRGTRPGVERARLREDMAEIVPRAEGLDQRLHRPGGAGVPLARLGHGALASGSAPTSRVCSASWSRSPNGMLDGRPTPRRSIKRKALGVQAGALMGYVARKVLGQYDVFLPPDDDGLLYFVGPNIVEVERRTRCRRKSSGCGSRSTR